MNSKRREWQQTQSLYFKPVNKRNFFEKERKSWLDRVRLGKTTTQELIPLILKEIEAGPIYYKKADDIIRNLNEIMYFFYRHSTPAVEPFGSFITNLALKDSDVDIFINFRGDLPEPPEKLLKTLRNKVRKYGYFISSVAINARVPIVHCIHRNRLSCDISFVKAFGVHNSHLIKFLLSLNERIRPVILIVKFLIKQQGLLGPNDITSFALIVLTTFFLQNLENPLIPSISSLQRLAVNKEVVDHWDKSFTRHVGLVSETVNTLSVAELLFKFFEFYSTFEFGFYVISIFTAQSYLKPLFSHPSLLPDDFSLYKKNLEMQAVCEFDLNKFMCVQSPFDHNVNVTRNIKKKTIVRFQELCHANANIGQNLLLNKEEDKVQYLKKIFEQKAGEPKRKKLRSEESVAIFVGENVAFEDALCSEADLRNVWLNNVLKQVQDILFKVMKCDVCLEVESGSFESEKKVLKCEFHYSDLITKKRNKVKDDFKFPKNLSDIELEEIISNCMCETVLKNSKKACLKFEISLVAYEKPTYLCLNLESKETGSGKNCFLNAVFNFIKNNFPKWIK